MIQVKAAARDRALAGLICNNPLKNLLKKA